MGTGQSDFDPMAWLASMMLISAFTGFFFMRESLGFPRPAWLRSSNVLKRGVTILVYFIGCFLPSCTLVMLVLWLPLGIDAIEAWYLSWSWQLRLAQFAVTLSGVWIALAWWLIRAAMQPQTTVDASAADARRWRALALLPARARSAAERGQAETEREDADWKLRGFGLFMLFTSLYVASAAVYTPYVALQAGYAPVAIDPVIVATLPFLFGAGLAYGVLGPSARQRLGNLNRPTLFGRAFAVVLLVAGVILLWWLTELGGVIDVK